MLYQYQYCLCCIVLFYCHIINIAIWYELVIISLIYINFQFSKRELYKLLVCTAEYRAHAADLFNRHRHLTLIDIYINFRLLSLYLSHKIIYYHLYSMITLSGILSYTVTSFVSADNFPTIRHHTSTRYFSTKVQRPFVWNGLNSTFREITHLSRFKRLIKDSLLSVYHLKLLNYHKE